MNRIEFSRNITLLKYEMLQAGDSPVDNEVLRTAEQQNIYFRKGRVQNEAGEWVEAEGQSTITKCDGYKKKSAHQSGCAEDIYFATTEGIIIFDVNAKGHEDMRERVLYWHKVWTEKYGGKPVIDWDLPHFEG